MPARFCRAIARAAVPPPPPAAASESSAPSSLPPGPPSGRRPPAAAPAPSVLSAPTAPARSRAPRPRRPSRTRRSPRWESAVALSCAARRARLRLARIAAPRIAEAGTGGGGAGGGRGGGWGGLNTSPVTLHPRAWRLACQGLPCFPSRSLRSDSQSTLFSRFFGFIQRWGCGSVLPSHSLAALPHPHFSRFLAAVDSLSPPTLSPHIIYGRSHPSRSRWSLFPPIR